jgi:hypothetical protein
MPWCHTSSCRPRSHSATRRWPAVTAPTTRRGTPIPGSTGARAIRPTSSRTRPRSSQTSTRARGTMHQNAHRSMGRARREPAIPRPGNAWHALSCVSLATTTRAPRAMLATRVGPASEAPSPARPSRRPARPRLATRSPAPASCRPRRRRGVRRRIGLHDRVGLRGRVCVSTATVDGSALADRCSAADCDRALDCVARPLPGTPCDDADLCTMRDACDVAGACTAAPITCVSGPCRVSSCDPSLERCRTVDIADGTPCDDGNAYTTGDVRRGVLCAGLPCAVRVRTPVTRRAAVPRSVVRSRGSPMARRAATVMRARPATDAWPGRAAADQSTAPPSPTPATPLRAIR